jgi:hypothetical protein
MNCQKIRIPVPRRVVFGFAVIATSCLSVTSSRASITLSYSSLGPNFDQGVLDEGGNPLAAGSTVQVIWSPTGIPNPPTRSGGVSGSELLLAIIGSTGDGFWASSGNFRGEDFGLGDDGLVPGYIYQRAFNVPFGDPIRPGDWYADSEEGTIIGGPLTDADPGGGGPPPFPNDATFALSDPYVLNRQVVPEPGSVALLASAIFSLSIRRRRPRH